MGRHRYEDHNLKRLRRRKYRLRGGGAGGAAKFIPSGDRDFASMARVFADYAEKDAARFSIAASQIEKLNAAVEAYRSALAATMRSDTEGPRSTRIKNAARQECEAVVRAVARTIRACESLTDVDRMQFNMTARPERAKARSCPQVAPVLTFMGNADGGRHVLKYGNDFDRGSKAKPKGAARLEVFVDLVPPPQLREGMPKHIASYDPTIGGQVPVHPMQTSGRLWYVGSFTTSKFTVPFPVVGDGTPMLVCYWARWADARGGVGPFSQTCVARVEGGTPMSLVEQKRFWNGRPEMAQANGGTRFIEPKQLAAGITLTAGMAGADTLRIEGRSGHMLPAGAGAGAAA